ncbi:MAG: DNRLRE domain-containing protein [Pirellulales bacterium]
MNRLVCAILFLFGFAAMPNFAAGAELFIRQPPEVESKDTFVYQGVADANFDTTQAGPFFGKVLGVGQTTTGHTTESLIQFDLSNVGMTSAQAYWSFLELRAVSTVAVGFGANPTPATPVVVDLYAVAGTWGETDVTWNTPAPATGALFASQTVDAIDQTYTFDITALVKQWLDGTIPNNGMILKGNAPVPSGMTFAAAVFSSSSGTIGPRLTIVPEPSSVVLALSAAGAVGLLYRRRTMRRHRIASE